MSNHFSFTALPRELKHRVLSFMNTAELVSLCPVSRDFNNLVHAQLQSHGHFVVQVELTLNFHRHNEDISQSDGEFDLNSGIHTKSCPRAVLVDRAHMCTPKLTHNTTLFPAADAAFECNFIGPANTVYSAIAGLWGRVCQIITEKIAGQGQLLLFLDCLVIDNFCLKSEPIGSVESIARMLPCAVLSNISRCWACDYNLRSDPTLQLIDVPPPLHWDGTDLPWVREVDAALVHSAPNFSDWSALKDCTMHVCQERGGLALTHKSLVSLAKRSLDIFSFHVRFDEDEPDYGLQASLLPLIVGLTPTLYGLSVSIDFAPGVFTIPWVEPLLGSLASDTCLRFIRLTGRNGPGLDWANIQRQLARTCPKLKELEFGVRGVGKISMPGLNLITQ